MAATTVGTDSLDPQGVPGCWCCGDRTVQASIVRLVEHPEVAVCFRCLEVLRRRQHEMQRHTRRIRSLPDGWSWWRRARYRAGFGRC